MQHGTLGTGADGMPKPLLIDTDVMVDFLRGNPKAVALVKTHSTRIILSAIVVAELYAGVRGDKELQTLDSLISLFRIIPVSPELARQGGLFKNEYTKSNGIGLADAIIAASAKAEQAELATLNVKHYPMFKGLRPPYKKS
jgi:predicted nucleic acid-binding protein